MKKITSVCIIIILIFICFEVLTESKEILNSVNFSFNIWKNNIFPSLFPFFVLADLLINYGFVELISNFFKGIMNKVFKIKGNCAFIFIMSMLSGNPSSAKYTKELYLLNSINEYEATKILCFSHFSNPLFIVGTVSILFLNNKDVGFFILFCHYIGNIIIGFLIRNYHPSKYEKNKFSLNNAINEMHNKRISNPNNFSTILSSSILNTINTLFLILGVVTVCLVITTILDNNLQLNSIYQSLLNGFTEMTQGLKYISLEDLPLKIKCTLSVMILSFGGISVHMQVLSIISDTKIKYFPFLVCRVLHSLISSLLAYILFDLLV